jgi:hypothetical protein
MTRFLLLGALGIVLYGALVYGLYKSNDTAKYDCPVASLHPDFPKEMRKACRETKP